MKIELQRTFNDYFQQFEEDESVNEKIKRLVLENIGSQEGLYPMLQRFLEIAKQKNYAYSIALGYAMLFYILYRTDLDQAIAYNEKARQLFMQIPDYENRDGILTVANNAVLADVLKEDYGAAYLEILKAMPIAEKRAKMTYYSAFLNNSAFILAEFGLYKKAIQQVEETMMKRDFIGDSNFIVTISLLGDLYVGAQETKKLREMLLKYAPYYQNKEFFDAASFDKYDVEAAIIEQDREAADRYFLKLQQTFSFEKNDIMESIEIYLVYARYYLFIENYEEAEKYYQIVFHHLDSMLGQKRRIHEEYALLKAKQNKYKEAYEHLKQAHDRSNHYMAFIDDMYRHELDDVWEKNRMLSYEVLYQRLLDITTFGKIVTSSLTKHQLVDFIQERLPQMFEYDDAQLLLYDEKNKQFQSLDDQIFPCHCHPLLMECVHKKEAILYGNLHEEDEISNQLSTLYKKNIRSILLQPVLYQDNIQAIIYFASYQINYYSLTDQGLLQVFADYVAIALHNIDRFEDALEKSSFDYLTGSYNRSALMQRGEQMLQRAKANGFALGALMMDIDDFKMINDTYGHMQGDEVIRKVTSIMDMYKQHGMIARFGGEEFILLIDHITREALYQIAEQIRYACENSILQLSEATISFTISIGGCYRDVIDLTLKEMFEEADQRLYVAKRNGKNCVQM